MKHKPSTELTYQRLYTEAMSFADKSRQRFYRAYQLLQESQPHLHGKLAGTVEEWLATNKGFFLVDGLEQWSKKVKSTAGSPSSG